MLTIILTAALVAASLWYINRIDRIEENEARLTGKDTIKTKTEKRDSGRKVKKGDTGADLESQSKAD